MRKGNSADRRETPVPAGRRPYANALVVGYANKGARYSAKCVLMYFLCLLTSLLSAHAVTAATDAGVQNPVVPDGRITQHHGQYPSALGNHTHIGVDIAAPQPGNCVGKETAVRAFADGVVAEVALDPGALGATGNALLVLHELSSDSRFYTVYMHLSSAPQNGDGVFLKQGDKVTRGQVIGYMGSTGASHGCHVHFEVKRASSWAGSWRVSEDEATRRACSHQLCVNIYGLGNVTQAGPYEENWKKLRDGWVDPLSLFCTYPGGMQSDDRLAGRCAKDQLSIAVDGVNLRSAPHGQRQLTLSAGEVYSIIAGPAYSDLYPHWWWNVGGCQDDGCESAGWVAAPYALVTRVVSPGETRAGYSLSHQRRATYREKLIAQVQDSTDPGLRRLQLLISNPSPVLGLEYVVVWDLDSGGRAARIVDPDRRAIISDEIVPQRIVESVAGRHKVYVPLGPVIRWSPREHYAITPAIGEVQDEIVVVNLESGRVTGVRVDGFERDVCDIQSLDVLQGQWVSDARFKFNVRLAPNPWAEGAEGYRSGMCEDARAFPSVSATLDVAELSVTRSVIVGDGADSL